MEQSANIASVKDTLQYKLLGCMVQYFKFNLCKRYTYAHLNTFSIIDNNDQHRKRFSDNFAGMIEEKKFITEKFGFTDEQSRGVACLLGLAIADALGASTQFIPFDKNRKGLIINGFSDITDKIRQKILNPRSGKVGIWTDDCSMALCVADSLLLNEYKFDPIHMRYLFILWLEHGLNNGGRPHSIGLGGNISISMKQFMKQQTQYAQEGSKFNNGNGSLMRLAPVPIAFHKNEQQAILYSQKQSRTTHNGDEAKQCCKLLALIIVRLINRNSDENWKQTVDKACQQFKTQVKSVARLAKSESQTQQQYKQQKQNYGSSFTKFNKELEDRNWNWKDKDFTYSNTRNKQQPGYIGSYCMDALSMALHMAWYTSSFKQLVIWSANMGGDCDTVGAIGGQIAGAIYGVSQDMLNLYSQMLDFTSGRYDVFIKGYKLVSRGKI